MSTTNTITVEFPAGCKAGFATVSCQPRLGTDAEVHAVLVPHLAQLNTPAELEAAIAGNQEAAERAGPDARLALFQWRRLLEEALELHHA